MDGTVTSKKIVGNVSSEGYLKGSVGTVFAKDGYSAYEIALQHGFVGTEEEWLASLKGETGATPIKGKDYFDAIYLGSGDMPNGYNAQIDPNGDALTLDELVKEVARYVVASPSVITSVTMPASAWEGADSLYSQVVTIDGITEYSKVDLLPSVEQLAIFHNKDVTFVTENEDGVVTVYAIGEKPVLDYTMQAQITEVAV